jgi:hypothetical protein
MIRRSRPRMTIAQLKQHMDRRFDRLQRTKANKVDLVRTNDDTRAGFANVNRQLDSLNEKIDGILRAFSDKYNHHVNVLNGHNERISDLERQVG